MSMSIAAGPGGSLLPAGNSRDRRHSRRVPERPARLPRRGQRRLAGGLASRPGRAGRQTASVPSPASAPGVIGGAILRAARRSAHLSRRSLARTLAVSPATLRAWENGTIPLFGVPYGQLRQLADALGQASAAADRDLGELLLASQCDLLVTGMLHGFEDYAEVPPIDDDGATAEAARDLVRWALAGLVPARYREHARPRPLLADSDVARFAAVASALEAGAEGADLTGFGAALMALISR